MSDRGGRGERAGSSRDGTVTVREATPDDHLGVRRVLDAAMLDVRDDLGTRIAAGDVLVASDGPNSPPVGALVLVPSDSGVDGAGDERGVSDPGAHEGGVSDRGAGVDAADASARVDAVAVRRARRGQGVGTALVRAAVERYPRLTAEFDPDVRSFYESLGFDISAIEGEEGRLRGRYED